MPQSHKIMPYNNEVCISNNNFHYWLDGLKIFLNREVESGFWCFSSFMSLMSLLTDESNESTH